MRLKPRKYITMDIVGPQNEEAGQMTIPAGAGVNLRSILDAENYKIYDTRSARFDAPYETGNCGGEGTCGTCMIQVMEGKEFFNERGSTESKAMAKQGHPANWRWSCRVKFKPGVNEAGNIKIMLRPQTRSW